MIGGIKTMAEMIINIATDFSKTPGGRYRTDGPASGEEFRERVLLPAVKQAREHQGHVTVILDGARGYPSSFLEEAFGGLVRQLKISPTEFRKRVGFTASPAFSIYVDDIMSYIDETAANA